MATLSQAFFGALVFTVNAALRDMNQGMGELLHEKAMALLRYAVDSLYPLLSAPE